MKQVHQVLSECHVVGLGRSQPSFLSRQVIALWLESSLFEIGSVSRHGRLMRCGSFTVDGREFVNLIKLIKGKENVS